MEHPRDDNPRLVPLRPRSRLSCFVRARLTALVCLAPASVDAIRLFRLGYGWRKSLENAKAGVWLGAYILFVSGLYLLAFRLVECRCDPGVGHNRLRPLEG